MFDEAPAFGGLPRVLVHNAGAQGRRIAMAETTDDDPGPFAGVNVWGTP